MAARSIEEVAQQQHVWDCQGIISKAEGRVRIWYRDRKGGTTERQVRVKWMSERAFGGWCELRGAERVFLFESVDRMEGVEI
jgi:predicted DNA-binding transcriptional regulator YafY